MMTYLFEGIIMERLEITIDVETIPTQNPAFMNFDVPCPGNISKADTIAKWEAEKKPGLIDDVYRKTSFDSTKGELIVIGWAIGDEEPQTVFRDKNEAESDLLRGFYDAIAPHLAAGGFHSRVLWIGHNLLRFDLPYLWHRTKINRVRPSINIPYDGKPWDERIFDTCARWKAASSASASLEAICTAIGIEAKQSMHGSEVWDYFQQGKIGEIADYCMDDVVATRELYNVMK